MWTAASAVGDRVESLSLQRMRMLFSLLCMHDVFLRVESRSHSSSCVRLNQKSVLSFSFPFPNGFGEDVQPRHVKIVVKRVSEIVQNMISDSGSLDFPL